MKVQPPARNRPFHDAVVSKPPLRSSASAATAISNAPALVRQLDDSTTRAIAAAAPALAEAMQWTRDHAVGLTRYTDQDLCDTLLAVPGAIGFLDAGTIALEGLPLVALRLDGVAADPAESTYPLILTLSVLTRANPTPREAELVAFLGSPEVAGELARAGYAPIAAPAPGAPGGP